jgi:acylglycerol lipase
VSASASSAPLALTSSDGLALVGSAWAPPGAPRAVLVVVHGLKDHIERYGELAAALIRAGVAVEGFDLRGHGRSAGPRAWVRRFDDLVNDLDRVVADVRGRHPGVPLFLFGHSMGGAVAIRFVETRSTDLRGLLLSGAAIRRPSNVSGGVVGLTKLLSAVAPHAAVFNTPNADFSKDPEVVAAMARDPLIYQRPAPARTAAELLRTMDRVRADAHGLTLPLLALHGGGDKLTHPRGSEELVASASSQDKSFRLFPGLWHDLLHEPERASVLEAVQRWLGPRLPG